jgi:hypothetical protein
MTYAIAQGVQVSLDGTTWYSLTDHNRQPIDITYTLIEQTDRMANGTLRKYIIARKFVHKIEWKDLPSVDSYLVDYKNPIPTSSPYGPFGAAWIKAFYEGNYNSPIYVKFIFAQTKPIQNDVPSSSNYTDATQAPVGTNPITGNSYNIYQAFMTTFTYNIQKRSLGNKITNGTGYDLINLTIEFTEI